MDEELNKKKLKKELENLLEKELINLRTKQCTGGYPAFVAERVTSLKLVHIFMKDTGSSFHDASKYVWSLIKEQRSKSCEPHKSESKHAGELAKEPTKSEKDGAMNNEKSKKFN